MIFCGYVVMIVGVILASRKPVLMCVKLSGGKAASS